MTGTTISTTSCGPVTVMLPTFHSLLMGVGNWLWNLPVRYCGIASVTPRASSAIPIVATSTITRGALKSRRITTSSTTVPERVPTIRAKISAGK